MRPTMYELLTAIVLVVLAYSVVGLSIRVSQLDAEVRCLSKGECEWR